MSLGGLSFMSYQGFSLSPNFEINQHFVLGKSDPVSYSISSTHCAFMTINGQLFGFGNNGLKQIDDSSNNYVSMPKKIFPENVTEFACGNGFTIGLAKPNKVFLRGRAFKGIPKGNTIAFRGLSARNESYSFAFDQRSVFISTSPSDFFILESPSSIVNTCLSENDIYVLSTDSSVYVHSLIDRESSFEKVSVSKIVSIFSSSSGIIMLDSQSLVHYYSKGKIITFYPKIERRITHIEYEKGLFLVVDETGKLGSASNESQTVTYSNHSFHWLNQPQFKGKVSYFSMLGERPLFFLGKAVDVKRVGKYLFEFSQRIAFMGEESIVYSYSDDTIYFANSNHSIIEFLSYIAAKQIQISGFYLKSPYQQLYLETGNEILFKYNILFDDLIEFSGNKFTIKGIYDGLIYGQKESGYYLTVIGSCESEEWKLFKIISRNGHQIKELIINHNQICVDTDCSFCEKFGYIPGELAYINTYGICEFIGVFAKSHVFMDVAERVPIIVPIYSSIPLKRLSKSLPHIKLLHLEDGTTIEVDFSVESNQLFFPTDRVFTPYGIATVIGVSNDGLCIQTDEMRNQGIDIVAIDASSISLLRRIGVGSITTHKLSDGTFIDLSNETENAPGSLMPGDVVQIGSTYALLYGYNENGYYGKYFMGDQIVKLPSDSLIDVLYRSDINAKSKIYEDLFVGSPYMPQSLLYPGDEVLLNNLGTSIFLGFSSSNSLFHVKGTGELLKLSITAVIYPELYKVVSQPVIHFLTSK